MLKKLYGGAAGHPNIAYPKLTTKPRKQMPKFIPGGAKLDATDARSNSHRREKASTVGALAQEVRAAVLQAHRFCGPQAQHGADRRDPRGHVHAQRRLPAASGEWFLDGRREGSVAGNRAVRGRQGSTGRDDPGQDHFTFREKSASLGEARVEREWRKRRGLTEEPAAAVEQPKSLQTQEIEQISREIEDRAAFLEEARAMGLKGGHPIKRVEMEITTACSSGACE